MPNGAYNPQCGNCDFFRYDTNRRCCQQHNFVMPELSELICKDYTHSHQATPFTDPLESGELYLYSYVSDDKPQSLGLFTELQTRLFQAQVRADNEYGWVIYIDDHDPFPGDNQPVALLVEQITIPSYIVHVERTLATGGTRLADNTWEINYTTQKHHLLVPEGKPMLLRDWLDNIYDLEANDEFIRNHEHSELLKDFGIFVLLKVLKHHRKYVLIPDFIQHITKFRRH